MSNILDRGLTESAAREKLRRDRIARWHAGRHGGGDYGILCPTTAGEVARCHREDDRDFLLRAAKSHADMRAALVALVDGIRDMRKRGVIDEANDDRWLDFVLGVADAALAKARGQ